jgi:hypothetical protein
MGILRIEPLDPCADAVAAELDAAPDRSEKFAAFATFGIDAARRPVPVVARNSLRSMLNDLRELFMRSPQQSLLLRFALAKPGGIIRCFLQWQAKSFAGF